MPALNYNATNNMQIVMFNPFTNAHAQVFILAQRSCSSRMKIKTNSHVYDNLSDSHSVEEPI